MATYSKQNGATVISKSLSIPYYGASSNMFFGGSSDYVAMLYFGSINALGDNEAISAAEVSCQVKGDTSSGNGYVTIGLISSAWNGSHAAGASALLSYLTGVAQAVQINYTTSAAAKTFSIASILATWAANPSAYSGIFFRNSSLPLARIGATGCAINITTVERGTPTAPGSVTASPTEVLYDQVTVRWGASTVQNDTISGYRVERADSSNGSNWGAWALLTSTAGLTATDSTTIALGSYRKYRVRASSSGGQVSGWTESGSVKRSDSAGSGPVITEPTGGWYTTLPYITFTKITGLSTYYWQYSVDGGVTWLPDGNGYTITTSYVSANSYFQAMNPKTPFQVRIAGMMEDWSPTDYTVSPLFFRSVAPLMPVLISPFRASGETVTAYKGAWLVVRMQDEPNGQAHSLSYRIDGGAWVSIPEATNIQGEKIVALRVEVPGTYEFRDVDEMQMSSGYFSLGVNIYSFVYTDLALASGDRPRVSHMTEPRVRVSVLCNLYGLMEPEWAEQVVAGQTSLRKFEDIVLELRRSIASVMSHLNGLGAGTLVSMPDWIPIGNAPRADAVMQLRTVIDKL